jgi:predicted RNase H-like nuclease (RuvC/YqgF family)
MQRSFLKILVIGLLLPLPIYAQSVADIARENRETKAAQDASGVKSKVITNQDLGEGPEGKPELREQPRSRAAVRTTDFSPSDRANDQRGEQWRKQIKEQETKIANLQARLDQIDAALRSNRNAQGAYNRYQTAQQDKAAQLQLELDEQHKKLEEMEDAARHAGTPSSVFDR